VAQHDFSRQPAILYWFDLATLKEMANPYAEDDDGQKKRAFYALTTRVQDGDPDDKATTFPLAPSAEQVGDFPVPPAMHVGYAVTWYGLSLAGVYMMRMLLTRGR
jgi:surfeit locus 1 family protein